MFLNLHDTQILFLNSVCYFKRKGMSHFPECCACTEMHGELHVLSFGNKLCFNGVQLCLSLLKTQISYLYS